MSGRVIHVEIPFDDGDRARAFYVGAFGWEVMPLPEMGYTMVMSGPSGEQGPTEAGTEFDPDLCDLFLSCAPEVLGGLDNATAWDIFLDIEPGAGLTVDPEDLVKIAKSFADFPDQKSGWFLGHSRRVCQVLRPLLQGRRPPKTESAVRGLTRGADRRALRARVLYVGARSTGPPLPDHDVFPEVPVVRLIAAAGQLADVAEGTGSSHGRLLVLGANSARHV